MARRSEPRKRAGDRSAGKGRPFMIALVVLAVIAGAGLIVFFMSSQQPLSSPPGGVAGTDFQTLKGRWLRPDGGYVLEIRNVGPDGRMEASYFNPRPINVSRVEASRHDQAISVFVELRDTGYPGCTYTLLYDPREDSLKGVYYQAAVQESYDIVFVRMKQE